MENKENKKLISKQKNEIRELKRKHRAEERAMRAVQKERKERAKIEEIKKLGLEEVKRQQAIILGKEYGSWNIGFGSFLLGISSLLIMATISLSLGSSFWIIVIAGMGCGASLTAIPSFIAKILYNNKYYKYNNIIREMEAEKNREDECDKDEHIVDTKVVKNEEVENVNKHESASTTKKVATPISNEELEKIKKEQDASLISRMIDYYDGNINLPDDGSEQLEIPTTNDEQLEITTIDTEDKGNNI